MTNDGHDGGVVAMGKLGPQSVLNAFHPEAYDVLTKINNLRMVCDTLETPGVAIDALTIKLFQPFQPMLSHRFAMQSAGIDRLVKEKKGAEFWIEEKFDGERVQIHKQGKSYRYFSRWVPCGESGMV